MRHPLLLALLLASLGVSACSDPVEPPRPAAATAFAATSQDGAAGSVALSTPSVRVTSAAGRPIAGVSVRFQVQAGAGSITRTEPLTDADGVASAGAWTLGETAGLNTVVATIPELPGVTITFHATAVPDGCDGLVTLDRSLGDFLRLKSPATSLYPCLLFDAQQSAGHEYLLLFENMQLTGAFDGALFPCPAGGCTGPAPAAYTLTLRSTPLGAPPVTGSPLVAASLMRTEPVDEHAWDFGAGRLREHHPEEPPGGVRPPQLLREGTATAMHRLVADPAVGDTIVQLRLEALPRLGIPATNDHKAVIRFVSPHIIIAEDVRLGTTLTRENGSLNTPLSEEDLRAIGEQYAANARVQGDLLFENRHNTAVEQVPPNRVIAVHSLMPADEIWGYTYSATNYFVWDFWVGTDGSTRGLNQHPQRVADNIFMHEIAHMRHWGLLQRGGQPPRGNRWLVEGFARFSERLPIAARLLGSTDPSRFGNVVLPRNPAFGNAFFLDDVPTYGSAAASMYFGYQTSAYVFDYVADQVALQGGDWRRAVREILLAGGSQSTLDAAVQRWLPGLTFLDLFTRARVALYADDIGTGGLPAWTQYHQYQLRESRQLPQQSAGLDPRVQWPRISPADNSIIAGSVGVGAAMGYVIDGTTASPSAVLRIAASSAPHATLTLVRIR